MTFKEKIRLCFQIRFKGRDINKELRKLNPGKVILQVTHAIQKQGIEKAASLYDEVYITNSYHDWDKEDLPKNVHVTDIIRNN